METTSIETLIASGGVSAIVAGVATWIGNIITNRIVLQQERSNNSHIEQIRADFSKDLAHQSEQLKMLSHSISDLLIRKREVYQDLAKSMRIFLKGNRPTQDQLNDFKRAYDISFLWASDELLSSLGSLIDALMLETRSPRNENQLAIKQLYEKCLMNMRKDSGFPDTKVMADTYRFFDVGNEPR